ncbi:MAG: carboxypeptidase regulatory-like domain-containing protein [Acidobacteriota bacterium]
MPMVKRIFLVISLSLVTMLAQPRQTLSQDSGTGVIAGRVTVNGVPARGVQVMAFYEGDGKQDEQLFGKMMSQILFGNGGDFVFKSVTDTNGQFRFSGMKSGKYEVRVFAPAMIGTKTTNPPPPAKGDDEKKIANAKKNDEDEDEDDDEESPEAIAAKFKTETNDSARKELKLGEGETVDNLEFSITRGGVITGRVTFMDGRPVIGEVVRLVSQKEFDGKNEYALSFGAEMFGEQFMTDDRGVYRIFGVPDGRYKIAVAFNGGGSIFTERFAERRNRHQTTYYPGTTDEATSGIVEVRGSGEVPNIDIKIGAPAKAYMVAGRVIDAETGKAIPGIVIRCTAINAEARSQGKSAPTNARGQFTIEGLTSGDYSAMIAAELMEDREFYGDATRFAVKDANFTNLEIKLYRGLTVSGTVVVEGAGSANVTVGLAGQYVSATSWEDRQGERQEGMLYTHASSDIKADGSFILKGLRPGKARIGVIKLSEGSGGYALKRVERSGVDITAGFDLRRGDVINDVRIVVAMANCTINGKVHFQGGTPPAGTYIYAVVRKPGAKDGEDDDDGFDARSSNTMVNKDGTFKLEGLTPGQYELVVIATMGGDEKEGDLKRRESKQLINLVEGQTLDVELSLDVSN